MKQLIKETREVLQMLDEGLCTEEQAFRLLVDAVMKALGSATIQGQG